MELTEVPPSICPMLKVVRGAAGTLVLMKRTEARARALMGLGMPKSDQLWPPGPVMVASRRREASALVVTWSVPEPSRTITPLNFEAGRGEKKLHGGGALRFLKWGRGNFGQARLLLVYPGEIAGKPGQRGAHFGIVSELRARSRTVAMRNTGGPDGHAEEDNPKGSVFHRGVPHVGRDQLRAASAQRACTSDSVRTRADCLAASKMRPTRASSAGMPWRSSQKSTLDLPLIGPISMIWSRPKRCEGTPL